MDAQKMIVGSVSSFIKKRENALGSPLRGGYPDQYFNWDALSESLTTRGVELYCAVCGEKAAQSDADFILGHFPRLRMLDQTTNTVTFSDNIGFMLSACRSFDYSGENLVNLNFSWDTTIPPRRIVRGFLDFGLWDQIDVRCHKPNWFRWDVSRLDAGERLVAHGIEPWLQQLCRIGRVDPVRHLFLRLGGLSEHPYLDLKIRDYLDTLTKIGIPCPLDPSDLPSVEFPNGVRFNTIQKENLKLHRGTRFPIPTLEVHEMGCL